MGFLNFGKKKEDSGGDVERRRYYRINKEVHLDCRDPGTRKTFSMETKDISIGGIRFVCPKTTVAFRTGDTLSIRFQVLPEIPPTDTIGKVSWLKDLGSECEGGIEFMGLNAEQLNVIKSAIQKLKTGESFPIA